MPLVLLDRQAKTLPVYVSGFVTSRVIDWEAMAAAASIAGEVSSLIEANSTVFLNAGSTGLAIAQPLVTRSMTVFTPGLWVSDALKAASEIRLMMTGGLMRAREQCFTGSSAIEMIGTHRLVWYVMTVSGLDLAGCTEWNLDDHAVKQSALSSARKTIVAADSSKFTEIAFSRVCPIERVDVGVTNSDADRPFGDGLRRLKIVSTHRK